MCNFYNFCNWQTAVKAGSRQPFTSYHYDRVVLSGFNEKLYSYLLHTQPQSLLCFPLSCVPRNIFPNMACVWNIQQMGRCQDSQSCYCFCVHRERQGTGARNTQHFSGQEKQTLKESSIFPGQMILKTSDDMLLCPDGIYFCLLKKNNNK